MMIFSLSSAQDKAVQNDVNWDQLDTVTRDALSLIANDNFVEAVAAIDKIEKSNLPISIADCLRAAMYYRITEEYRTRDFEKEFDESIKKGIDTLVSEEKDKEKGDKYKAKRLQFLGSAYGYRGMYRVFTGEWASAFFDGKRGADVLEQSYALDNNLVDNKAGIGTYLYWRSAKSGIVKYLLFWGDKKEEGIAGIKEGAEKGKIVKLWALGGLLRIYMEERKGKLSLEVIDKILATVPNDSGTMRRKAFVLEKKEQKAEAIKVYEHILALVKAKDNIVIKGKTLNTANVQIDTIYNILRLNKEMESSVVSQTDKEKYKAQVEELKKRIVPSHFDIEKYVQQVKEF
jgi:tetratricopeptide (TPR) repeat protein